MRHPWEFSGNSGGLEGELRSPSYICLKQKASCQIQALRLMQLYLHLRDGKSGDFCRSLSITPTIL